MRLVDLLKEDIKVNAGSPKTQLAIVMFRVAQRARSPRDQPPALAARPIGLLYRLVVEWILGIEIPWRTRVGRRLRIHHGVGIVINQDAIIGDDVAIRQGVTIGNSGSALDCPVIGDRVSIGAGAVVIGGISIGPDSKVGANAVVTRDVPASSTAIGVPARVIEATAAIDVGQKTD